MATRVVFKTAACAILATCAASASLPALALGLGELEMQSFLNEPLRAELELLDTRDLTADDIRIRLAGVDDFERLGVDRSYFLTSIDFEVDLDPDTGRGVIRLSTEDAVLEPYLDLIVEARWPSGRVLREYTVLVDPPAFRQEVISVSAAERVQAAQPDKPAVAQASAPASEVTESRESGDRVAVRESSLPPGAMPDRAFSADTANEPAAGSRYMVRRDETLWQIASRGRPEGISVQQAMLDIQRVNPEAFIDGNINRIKAGYIIYLPAAGEVSSDDLAAAIEEVREQNRAYEAGRSAPGVSAAATLRVSADTGTGASVADSSRAAAADQAPEPDLAAVDTSPPGAAGDAGGAGDAAAAASGAAMDAELAAQLREMSGRLDTLEQIVSLKDEQIATLEAALREAREEAAAARAQPSPAAAPAPAPAAPARPTTPPAAPAGPGIPWLPIAGGLLVVVLAVVLLLRRRAASAGGASLPLSAGAEKGDDDDVFAGVSLKRDALEEDVEAAAEAPAEPSSDTLAGRIAAAEAAAAGGAAAASPAEFDRGGSRGYGERKHDDYIDEGSAGDALAEADIYIAYGRYMQAIELLDTAIAEEPNNTAYRLKLIELYVDMGEEENAAAQLEALRQHGDADAVARGEALVGTGALAPPPADVPDPVDIPEPGEDVTDRLALADAPSPAGAADDNDVGLPRSDMPGEPAVDEEGVALELDLDEDDAFADYSSDEPAKRRFSEGELAAEEGTGSREPDDLAVLSNRVGTDEPLEFDELQIEDDLPRHDDGDDGMLHLDDDEDDLDFTDALMGADAGGTSSGERDAGPGAAEANGNELLIAEDADQVATKLDLARAYLDMGDSEGARGILEDIAGAGTEEQQGEARALLERIG